MKRLFTITLSFIFIQIQAQSNFEGIGIFKINQLSFDNFTNYLNKSGYTSKDVFDERDFSIFNSPMENSIVCHFVKSLSNDFKNEAVLVGEGLSSFFINEIKFSGIKIENLYLNFFHDTLVSLSCNYADNIFEAFTVKYGKSMDTVLNSPNPCFSPRYGSQIIYSTIANHVWINHELICQMDNGQIFDKNCYLQNYSGIIIRDQKKYDAAKKISDNLRLVIKKENDKKRIAELKDF